MDAQTIHKSWTFLEKYLFRWACLFFPVFILSFEYPNPMPYFPNIGQWVSPFFEKLASFSASYIFNIENLITIALFSDSTGFYINAFNVLWMTLFGSLIWAIFDKRKKHYRTLQYYLFTLIRYYLALQMLVYGFSKVFKWQFYLPEPNILYTPLGDISKDLLYWSTMGMSRTYTVFGGVIELIIAVLLLFRKTRLLAAALGLGVMTNVVLINLSYNISVKLYSIFLFVGFLTLLLPDMKRLFRFFIKNKTVEPSELWFPIFEKNHQKRLYRMAKTLVIGLMLMDTLYMYLQANNFNDDLAQRPRLHGAYEVKMFLQDQDTVPLVFNSELGWKRFFVHRQGYFIVQKMNDKMVDFKLSYEGKQHLALISPRDSSVRLFEYEEQDNIFILKNDQYKISAEKLNLDKLPLMKKEFYWTVDEY